MKKIQMMLAAAAAVVMSSCGGSAPKANLENDVDSVCYAFGVSQSQGFADYVCNKDMGLGVDSAYMDEVIKGLMDGANLGGSEKQKAYYAGVALGQQIANNVKDGLRYQIFGRDADSTQVVNINDFLAGFINGIKNDTAVFNSEGARKYIETQMAVFQKRAQEASAKKMEEEYGEYKKQNEAYMKKVAKNDSVQALDNGVYYKVLKAGKGEIPTADSRVRIHYEGKTIDGNVFDSSYKRNEPQEFSCSQVVTGFSTALTHMPVGSKWEVYIPAEAGYGAQNTASIKPFSTLIFTIELLEVIK